MAEVRAVTAMGTSPRGRASQAPVTGGNRLLAALAPDDFAALRLTQVRIPKG